MHPTLGLAELAEWRFYLKRMLVRSLLNRLSIYLVQHQIGNYITVRFHSLSIYSTHYNMSSAGRPITYYGTGSGVNIDIRIKMEKNIWLLGCTRVYIGSTIQSIRPQTCKQTVCTVHQSRSCQRHVLPSDSMLIRVHFE